MARALILLLAVAAAAARDDDEDAAWDAFSAAYSEQVYRETRAGRRLAATAGRSYRGATVVGGVVRAVTEPVVQGKRKVPPYWAALHSARPQAEPVAGTWRGLRGERVQDGDMRLLSLLFYGSSAYKHTDVEATVGNTKLKCASFSGARGCPRAGRRLDQYRVLCGREGWHAHEAVAAGRSDASVTFGPREGCADPPTLTLRFELEALAALPAPVAVASCGQLNYGSLPARMVAEWAAFHRRVAGLCVEIKFYGAFVLNHRVDLHAIDATPARWRGDAGSSPLDRARTAACTRRSG